MKIDNSIISELHKYRSELYKLGMSRDVSAVVPYDIDRLSVQAEANRSLFDSTRHKHVDNLMEKMIKELKQRD